MQSYRGPARESLSNFEEKRHLMIDFYKILQGARYAGFTVQEMNHYDTEFKNLDGTGG